MYLGPRDLDPVENLWDVRDVEKAVVSVPTRSIIHTGSWGNINARLDRNKSCDIAKAAHFLTRQIPDLPSRYQNKGNRGRAIKDGK